MKLVTYSPGITFQWPQDAYDWEARHQERAERNAVAKLPIRDRALHDLYKVVDKVKAIQAREPN